MNTPVRLCHRPHVDSLRGWLVPVGLRHDWRSEWDAELASLGDLPARYRRPIRRALGAFADAFWLRQRSIADFDWIDDVRHGLRQLVQHGGFATTVIAHPGLGLAATVTMFSVTDQILLRPLPYPAAERIVTVWETRGAGRRGAGRRARQLPRLARARAVVRVSSPASSPGRSTSTAVRARKSGRRPR